MYLGFAVVVIENRISRRERNANLTRKPIQFITL